MGVTPAIRNCETQVADRRIEISVTLTTAPDYPEKRNVAV
jgi:hypothetical protein